MELAAFRVPLFPSLIKHGSILWHARQYEAAVHPQCNDLRLSLGQLRQRISDDLLTLDEPITWLSLISTKKGTVLRVFLTNYLIWLFLVTLISTSIANMSLNCFG